MHLETVTEIAAVITPFKDLFNATHADVDVIGHICLCEYLDYVSCLTVIIDTYLAYQDYQASSL